MRWNKAIVAAFIFCFSAMAAAQPLADRVPDDAILYIGWVGSDQPGPGYAKSHLKAVIDASDAGTFIHQTLPEFIKRIAARGGPGAQVPEGFAELGEILWKNPTALAVSVRLSPNGGPPMPSVALICDAAGSAARLEELLQHVLPPGPPGPGMEVRVTHSNSGTVALVIGPADGKASPVEVLIGSAQGPKPATLAGSAAFKDSMKKIGGEPVAIVYANVEKIVSTLDAALAVPEGAQLPPDSPPAVWKSVRAALAIDGLKRFVWLGGFEGANWGERMFIDAPSPRAGLAKMLEGTPLSDKLFALIPASAATAAGFSLDLAALVHEAHAVAPKISPAASAQLDQMIAGLNKQAGLDVEKELLAAFGPEWAYYSDQNVGGTGIMGTVLVNRLRDPAQAAKALAHVERLLNGLMAQNAGPDMNIAMRVAQYDGNEIHYLGVPLVAPSWLIKGDVLYLGLQPQVVAAAAAFTASGDPSFLKSPDFMGLRQRLHADGPITSFQYMDLPHTINDGYQIWLPLTRAITGSAEMFGATPAAMLLPPLNKLRQQLAPMAAVTWSDADGIHERGVGPFPAAELLGSQQSLVIVEGSFMAGILLPSLGRAREVANRTVVAANLSGVYKTMYVYSVTHNDKFPATLGEMVKDGSLPAKMFIDPRIHKSLPPGVAQMSLDDQAKWVDANSDLVLVQPNKGANEPADNVIAYEKIQPGITEGINLCYGDGHVAFTRLDEAIELLQKAGVKIDAP